MICHWRDFAEDTSQFHPDECVLISPRLATIRFKPPFLPYFAVRSKYRQFIYEQLTGQAVPPGSVIRHLCLFRSKEHIDSRGLCINPHHVCLGTEADNTRDAYAENLLRTQLNYWTPDASTVETSMFNAWLNRMEPTAVKSDAEEYHRQLIHIPHEQLPDGCNSQLPSFCSVQQYSH